MQSLVKANLSLPLLHRGKVRDIFDIDKNYMLIVTTDRLSAFDVVFDQPIPDKGKILTSIANYWFNKTDHIIQNHLSNIGLEDVLSKEEAEALHGRAIVVKKLKPIAIEAVVRGYLIGSGWKEYNSTGSVCGISLPPQMRLAEKLESPLYTPSSKAAVGEHDANISRRKLLRRPRRSLRTAGVPGLLTISGVFRRPRPSLPSNAASRSPHRNARACPGRKKFLASSWRPVFPPAAACRSRKSVVPLCGVVLLTGPSSGVLRRSCRSGGGPRRLLSVCSDISGAGRPLSSRTRRRDRLRQAVRPGKRSVGHIQS